MLSRAELLRELDRSYSRFAAEIEMLDDDQLEIVGVTRLWSMRDLLAHLIWWQTQMELRAAGRPVEWNPEPGESKEAYVDRLNAKAVEKAHHQSGRQVLEAFRASHAKMIELASTLTDEQLSDERLMTPFGWDTYEHYDGHFESIRKFVTRHARRPSSG